MDHFPLGEVVLKQLPPSASTLALYDVGSRLVGLVGGRADIQLSPLSLLPHQWTIEDESADAIVACDYWITPEFLARSWRALRAGGRMVIVLPYESFSTRYAKPLKEAGFVRLLIETAHNGVGVLIRGERPHTTGDTLARVRVASDKDSDVLTLETYTGRYLHFVGVQFPDKPPWKLTEADVIEWHALTLERVPMQVLAFTSLPKAIAFMQEAVLAGKVRHVNKVAKYRVEQVKAWGVSLLLNPTLAMLDASLTLFQLDHTQAERPDE